MVKHYRIKMYHLLTYLYDDMQLEKYNQFKDPDLSDEWLSVYEYQ